MSVQSWCNGGLIWAKGHRGGGPGWWRVGAMTTGRMSDIRSSVDTGSTRKGKVGIVRSQAWTSPRDVIELLRCGSEVCNLRCLD